MQLELIDCGDGWDMTAEKAVPSERVADLLERLAGYKGDTEGLAARLRELHGLTGAIAFVSVE